LVIVKKRGEEKSLEKKKGGRGKRRLTPNSSPFCMSFSLKGREKEKTWGKKGEERGRPVGPAGFPAPTLS